jgi:glucose/arabinose dehydrogenase
MTPRTLACALALALAAVLAPAASAAPHLTPVANFTAPVYVTSPPGDPHRLFVVEQPGRIMEVRDGQKLATPFLDISGDVRSAGSEQGLLSVAFAPDYATSRKFYVYYTAPRPGDSTGSVVTMQEIQAAAGNPDAADPATRRTILTIDHPTNGNHNGGQLQFGPDGALYAGTGDGGSGNDPPGNAQNPSVLLGKLLRLDLNGGASVVALGLRNPWRFSFDRQTHDLVIADVGQNAYEEVDFAPAGTPAGVNYGWRCFEGFHRTANSCASTGGMTAPVFEMPHSGTGFCAIVGGYVIRDPALGALNGRYIYGDNCSPEVLSAALVAPPARVTDNTDTGLRVNGLTSFGEDSCGHVYLASGGGPVYRLDGDSFTPCPGAGPAVRIRGKARQRLLRQRGLRLTVSCSEPCKLTVSAKIRISHSKKRYALRTARRQLAKPAKLRLRLTKRARRAVSRALHRHRRVKIAVRASAANTAGDRTAALRTFRARR